MLNRFGKNFCASIDGATTLEGPGGKQIPIAPNVKDGSSLQTELIGGARIHHVLNNIFVATLDKLDALEGISELDIRVAIYNAGGIRHRLFMQDGPFETLVRLQLARLEPPSRQCAQQIHTELLRIFDTVPVPAAPFAVSCFGSL